MDAWLYKSNSSWYKSRTYNSACRYEQFTDTEKIASQISWSIIELGTSLKNNTNTVSISAIVPRSQEL